MKLLTLATTLICLYFPSLVFASEKSLIQPDEGHYHGGLYFDNLNSLNARFGYSYYLSDNPVKSGSLQTSVLSSELEVGLKGYKVTLSHGHVGYSAGMGGALRYGLSYANIGNDNLAGVESVLSVIGVSFKLGLYRNLDQDSNEVMLGIGFGL